MEMAGLDPGEETPETVELERLKAAYRRQNIALDQSREALEEQLNSGRYSDEEATEMSSNFEASGREMLGEFQARIEAHCVEHNLRP